MTMNQNEVSFDECIDRVLYYGFKLIPCYLNNEFAVVEISRVMITYKKNGLSYTIWKRGEIPNDYMVDTKFVKSIIYDLYHYLEKMESNLTQYPATLTTQYINQK